MLKTESFCKVSEQEVTLVLKKIQEETEKRSQKEKRANLIDSLGLGSQPLELPPDLGDIGKIYPELKDQELRIWHRFLPTRYCRNKGQWSGYNFDVIPTEALEYIQTAVSLGVFSDMEIWTPEQKTDPMAVGVIKNNGSRFFQIVRWGESLAPFEEIKRKVLRRISSNFNVPEQLAASLFSRAEGYEFSGRSVIRRHCRQTFFIFRISLSTDLYVCGVCGFSKEIYKGVPEI